MTLAAWRLGGSATRGLSFAGHGAILPRRDNTEQQAARQKASEVLAEGAAVTDKGADGMNSLEDMNISDGAGAEP